MLQIKSLLCYEFQCWPMIDWCLSQGSERVIGFPSRLDNSAGCCIIPSEFVFCVKCLAAHWSLCRSGSSFCVELYGTNLQTEGQPVFAPCNIPSEFIFWEVELATHCFFLQCSICTHVILYHWLLLRQRRENACICILSTLSHSLHMHFLYMSMSARVSGSQNISTVARVKACYVACSKRVLSHA